MSNREYFSRRRQVLQNDGFRIIGTISSEMDALTGSSIGKLVFKIPSHPIPQTGNEINARGETRKE